MINLSQDQENMLKEYAPSVLSFVNSEDPNDFYFALDDAIIENLTEDQNYLTEIGAILQNLYDDIFNSNENI